MKTLNSIAYLALATLFFNSCKPTEQSPQPKVEPTVTMRFNNQFGGQALVVDSNITYTNEAGNQMQVNTFKYLISDIEFIGSDGDTNFIKNVYGYINPLENRLEIESFTLPAKDYAEIRFKVGLDSAVNHGNPNQYAATHPLNPILNNMHWNWSGGYIFCTLEGYCMNTPSGKAAYNYHIALDENLMQVSVKKAFNISGNKLVNVVFDMATMFKTPNLFDMNKEGLFSHSTNDKGICYRLSRNMQQSFSIGEITDK